MIDSSSAPIKCSSHRQYIHNTTDISKKKIFSDKTFKLPGTPILDPSRSSWSRLSIFLCATVLGGGIYYFFFTLLRAIRLPILEMMSDWLTDITWHHVMVLFFDLSTSKITSTGCLKSCSIYVLEFTVLRMTYLGGTT